MHLPPRPALDTPKKILWRAVLNAAGVGFVGALLWIAPLSPSKLLFTALMLIVAMWGLHRALEARRAEQRLRRLEGSGWPLLPLAMLAGGLILAAREALAGMTLTSPWIVALAAVLFAAGMLLRQPGTLLRPSDRRRAVVLALLEPAPLLALAALPALRPMLGALVIFALLRAATLLPTLLPLREGSRGLKRRGGALLVQGRRVEIGPQTQLTLRPMHVNDPTFAWMLTVDAVEPILLDAAALPAALIELLNLQQETGCTLQTPWGAAEAARPFSLQRLRDELQHARPDLRARHCPGLLPGAAAGRTSWRLPRFTPHQQARAEDELNELEAAGVLNFSPSLLTSLAFMRRRTFSVALELTPETLTVDGHTLRLDALQLLSAAPDATAPLVIADTRHAVLLHGLTHPGARAAFVQHLLIRILAAQGDPQAAHLLTSACVTPDAPRAWPSRRDPAFLGLGIALLLLSSLLLTWTVDSLTPFVPPGESGALLHIARERLGAALSYPKPLLEMGTLLALLAALMVVFNTTSRTQPLRRLPLLLLAALTPALVASCLTSASRELGIELDRVVIRKTDLSKFSPYTLISSLGPGEHYDNQGMPIPRFLFFDLRINNYPKRRNADLSGADLRGINLHGIDLNGADLSRAQLDGVKLAHHSLHNARFKNATLSDADLTRANLQGADLTHADLRRANLQQAYLPGANLLNTSLSRADLRRANLNHANLSGADLRDADLRSADLRSADLRSADLRGADLSGAGLSDADLSGANLSGANLRSANLSGANLSDADLSGADFNTIALASNTIVSSNTRCPDGQLNLNRYHCQSPSPQRTWEPLPDKCGNAIDD